MDQGARKQVKMADEQFLVRYRDGETSRLALQSEGETYALLGVPSLAWLLHHVPASEITQRLRGAKGDSIELDPKTLQPPVDLQEVWAAGVTYKRSEEARERESGGSTIYSRVYDAVRPELFFKANGGEVVANGGAVGIRYDAQWSVPEPELVLVLNARLEVVGFTIGNDMSSRDIEAENPLYLPQAKIYEGSCAIGPRLWLQPEATTWPAVTIRMTIWRDGSAIFEEATSTANLHRSLADLVEYLGRCKRFAEGVLLFTGTGIVPPDSFSLAAGDEIRIRIDPIGELVNTVQVIQHG